jgi:AcrR family transcriptional regulator
MLSSTRPRPSTIPGVAAALTKGERTRGRLLEAAVRRFAADGYRRTSVSDIAREAGLTPAAVYAYFPNKEALFRDAVDDDAAALIERARPPRAETGPLGERWLAMPARLLALLPEYPLARRVLAAQEPEVLAQLLELPSLADLRAQLSSELAAAQRSGDARADFDPDVLAIGLETIVLALMTTSVHVPSDDARSRGVLAVLDAATRAPVSAADAPQTRVEVEPAS